MHILHMLLLHIPLVIGNFVCLLIVILFKIIKYTENNILKRTVTNTKM